MLISKQWVMSIVLTVVIAMQLWLIGTYQLFGDEAFYWLEGQNLAWSYAELPAWTAWMIRLGTELFGEHYFAVRLFSYVSFLSGFYAVYLIHKALNSQQTQLALLLLISLPIYLIVSILSLPDVWLAVFVLWLTYFIIHSVSLPCPRFL